MRREVRRARRSVRRRRLRASASDRRHRTRPADRAAADHRARVARLQGRAPGRPSRGAAVPPRDGTAAVRHRQAGDPRIDLEQAGQAVRRGVGDHQDPPEGGREAGARHRRLVPAGPGLRPAPPRALGRRRLSRGQGLDRDPRDGSDRRRRRRLRRDHLRAPPRAGEARSHGRPGHPRRRRHAVRPDDHRRVLAAASRRSRRASRSISPTAAARSWSASPRSPSTAPWSA